MSNSRSRAHGSPVRLVRKLARTVLLAVCLLGTAMLSGCTVFLWHRDGWWPISREEYQAIDAAAIAKGMYYLRVVRAHGEPHIFAARLVRPWLEQAHLEPFAGSYAALPPSAARVRILSGAELEHRFDPGMWEGFDYLVWLEGQGEDVTAFVLDSRSPDRPLRFPLPDPAIAWLTPNAIGHVAITPATFVLDVVCLPLYAVGLVLYATGVIHGT